MGIDIGIDERLRLQLGLVTRAQARACGLGRSAIEHRLTTKAWDAVLPGVYRMAAAARTAEQRILGHCLHLDGYASHETAAWLWGLSGFPEPEKVHVTAPLGKKSTSEEVVVHTRAGTVPEGFMFRRGVRVTLLKRTLLDLAPLLSRDRLEIVLDSGWRLHRDLFDELDEFVSGLKPQGRGGIARLIELVMIRRGTVPTDSDFETQVLQRVRNAGLVMPVLQHHISDTRGPILRADFVWPGLKLVLLPDGLSFHKTRWQFGEDAVIRARLTAADWRYLVVPRHNLDDPRWLETLGTMVPRVQMALLPPGPRRARPAAPRLSRKRSGPSTQLSLLDDRKPDS